jgi:hypothetical protein
MAEDINDVNDTSFVAAQGLTLNAHERVYDNGKSFSHTQNVEIAQHIILGISQSRQEDSAKDQAVD